ncbi:Ig-like domain-containing protein, partial [Streptomyces sodiiphilus]|uniref:Ig-like domain-containing protein n=1 Tax=Streptomyces sodiiphilus TaxID=226217 RepID=UPI0031DA1BA2
THNHTVLAADTTTTVITGPDPSAFGQPVVLTATVAPVAPGTGVPTGTLTFTVNGGPLITVPVEVNGTATTTLTTLPTGTRTITATYNAEDPNYNPSNGTTTHTVNQAATETAVNSTPHPSTLGQLVTFSATVTPVPPGAGTPTGTVTFVIDGGPTLTASLDSDGTATVATAALGVGSSPVTATYNGTTDFATSAGSTVHTVDRAPTTTTVTTSPDPSLFGQNVTFTATVAPVPPGAGTPTGTVTFLVDGGAGGTFTVPLVGGVATASTSTLGIGPHVISAVYSGDAGFATSTGADTHQVDRTPTTTTVTSSPNPSRAGLIATFTATVTPNPPGTGTPTGTVTFVIGNDTLTAALVNGVATVTDRLGTGVYTVTATYSGDAQFAPSTGTHLHEVIPAS